MLLIFNATPSCESSEGPIDRNEILIFRSFLYTPFPGGFIDLGKTILFLFFWASGVVLQFLHIIYPF